MSDREIAEAALGWAELIVLVALVVAAIAVFVAVRRRRDAKWCRRWLSACAEDDIGTAGLVWVESVYQHARRGTKGIVQWRRSGHRQDTWFEGYSPKPGTWLLLRGGSGWGPHNSNPDVLFVRGILDVLPGSAPRRAARHLKRRARADARRLPLPPDAH